MNKLHQRLKLTKATKVDIPFLIRLRESTMNAYMQEAGIEITDAVTLERVNFAFDRAHIIYDGEQAIGVFKFKINDESVDIEQIQISPNYQGKGIGRFLISQLMTQEPTKAFELTVLKTNPAKSLYESLGFRPYKEDCFEHYMRYIPTNS